MKNVFSSFLIAGLFISLPFSKLQAQTLNVNMGNVTFSHSAASTGDMVFNNGTTLTIEGRAYNLSDISSVTVDDRSVSPSTVSVAYNGASANVVVAGNIARYLTVSASGANVSIVQSESLQSEVNYTLSGTSTNGSFFMDGSFKANFTFDNLSLTNPSGAAIDIEDGKKIDITLVGTNTLTDGAGGSQNACFYVNGHPEFLGTGTLNVKGNTKHALSTDEYMMMTSGTINVTGAVGDGLHVSQYFKMTGGTVNIQSQGDGIDIGFKGVNKGTKDQYEDNGFAFLGGGTLTIAVTGAASKGLKADSTVIMTGGTTTISTSGAAYYDTTERDLTSASALKTDGAFTMSAGTLTLSSTGDGGKGLNATEAITISGGRLVVTTTGDTYTYSSSLDTKPHGVKTDDKITISGGEAYVAASNDEGVAFKHDLGFAINGGTLMGIGGKKSTVKSGSQGYKTYTGVKVSAGGTVSYNGVSYTVPSNYSNSSAFVVVSKPGI